MKRSLCLLLAALLALTLLAGCSPGSAYAAANEIYTYTKIDSQKIQLTVSRTGNIDTDELFAAFSAANPDIQLITLDITGGRDGCVPAVQWLENGVAPDIMIAATSFIPDDDSAKYLKSFSADPVIQSFQAEALQRTAINSNIYWLPGPSGINGMMYNKTLFAKYGWTPPATFEEFIALCAQIKKDTLGEVEPWNPNAKYSDELHIAITGMVYEEIFAGTENRSWYNDFLSARATFAGHMEPYYQVVKELAEAGLLREEHFSYSATTRGEEFDAGRIAMINGALSAPKNDLFEFGYMPFPTTKGSMGYINDNYSCLLGVPNKEHGKKEAGAVDRFVAFFASAEGQRALINDSMKVSNVKDVSVAAQEGLAELQPVIDAGHMFAKVDFAGELGKANVDMYESSLALVTGEKTIEQCVADADKQPFAPEEAKAEPAAVAAVPDNMTVLETSQYIADAYREKTGADIGLIAHNTAFRGNLMRLFKGDITQTLLTVLKPRSFANDSKLIRASMTGEQLISALNSPPDYEDGTANCVYAFSGLKCEVAPWNEPGKRYLSIKLADGSAIDPERLYTVGIWDGSVKEEFITEKAESFDCTFEEMLADKMTADKEVRAAKDGRIKLIWS